jgi:hypothetical protein
LNDLRDYPLLRDYPPVTQDWVRRMCPKASDFELIIAHRMGFIKSDAEIAAIWAKFEVNSIEAVDEFVEYEHNSQFISDKYFALLLINLFENWFVIKNPKKALESLVLDFRYSELLSIEDRMLPARVAGISEFKEPVAHVDLEEYKVNIRVHHFLEKYAIALLEHKILLRSVDLAR